MTDDKPKGTLKHKKHTCLHGEGRGGGRGENEM